MQICHLGWKRLPQADAIVPAQYTRGTLQPYVIVAVHLRTNGISHLLVTDVPRFHSGGPSCPVQLSALFMTRNILHPPTFTPLWLALTGIGEILLCVRGIHIIQLAFAIHLR